MTTVNRKTGIYTVAFVLLIIFVFVICQTVFTEPKIQEITGFHTSYDYAATESLSGMFDYADYIVIGEYTGFDSTWNMARDNDDVSKEASDLYVEGHLYNFSVDEVLKGDIPEESILINHEYSTKRKVIESNEVIKEGSVVKKATKTNAIEFTVLSERFIEPEISSKYILFYQKTLYSKIITERLTHLQLK